MPPGTNRRGERSVSPGNEDSSRPSAPARGSPRSQSPLRSAGSSYSAPPEGGQRSRHCRARACRRVLGGGRCWLDHRQRVTAEFLTRIAFWQDTRRLGLMAGRYPDSDARDHRLAAIRARWGTPSELPRSSDERPSAYARSGGRRQRRIETAASRLTTAWRCSVIRGLSGFGCGTPRSVSSAIALVGGGRQHTLRCGRRWSARWGRRLASHAAGPCPPWACVR
jgi:hypothetical protein